MYVDLPQIYTGAMEVERALAFFETWCNQGVDIDTYCFNAVMGAALKGGLTAKVSEVGRSGVYCSWRLRGCKKRRKIEGAASNSFFGETVAKVCPAVVFPKGFTTRARCRRFSVLIRDSSLAGWKAFALPLPVLRPTFFPSHPPLSMKHDVWPKQLSAL